MVYCTHLHISQTPESNKINEILLAKIKLNVTYVIQQKRASVQFIKILQFSSRIWNYLWKKEN